MLDNDQLDFLEKHKAETIAPYATSLIQNFRALGYNLPTALADIIDNSISAGAENVWLNFVWKGAESFISIIDDGHGMTKKELIEALRPGVENPLADREPRDMGRFGLGLKTASFSQCKRLTVASKTGNEEEVSYRAWDLDFVTEYNSWTIIKYISDPIFLDELNTRKKGTMVLWERLDRIVYDKNTSLITHKKFLEAIREVEQHISMVFHRFIETSKVQLWINNQYVQPWDPFLRVSKATRSFPLESYASDKVKVIGYVLPHNSKISKELWERAAGPNGWNDHQGFYIYRKDRMLLAGDWLQLFSKVEYTRLARIMIDVDASLDFDWQLDIRKSKAIPPKMFRDELKRYANGVRRMAIEVFKHRGKQEQRKIGQSHFEFVWNSIQQGNRDYFRINRKHPLVGLISEKLGSNKKDLDKLLRLLEITLPIPAIVLTEGLNAETPSEYENPVKDEEVNELMKSVYSKLLKDGLTPQQAIEELFFIDPFSNYPHLIETLRS